jgi:hypothetical protein
MLCDDAQQQHSTGANNTAGLVGPTGRLGQALPALLRGHALRAAGTANNWR